MDTPPPPDLGELSPLKRFLQFLGLSRSPDTPEDLEHEIQELVEEGEESGFISPQEGRMITSILEFGETLTHEVMTPRTEIVSAASSVTIPDVIKLIIKNGFSRIPVYNEDQDKIIGILHVKDLLSCTTDSEPRIAGDLAKSVYFVPETKKIIDLLREFQSQKIHMAIVTDEFGGIRGLVTLEDILEEIVGEINDEHDKSEKLWEEVDLQTLLTDAARNVEEIESYFQVELPKGPYESAGGLVIHQIGRVPAKGTNVEIDNLNFQVISATKRRINTLKIQKIA